MIKDSPSTASEWVNRTHPIQEDMAFQKRTWAGQRVGWLLLLALLVAASLGLFSDGLFSWTTSAASDDQLRVQYQMAYRNGASASLSIQIPPGGAVPEKELIISHSLMQALSLETIRPTPVRSETRADGLHLLFASPADTTGTIYVTIRPEQSGLVNGAVKLVGTGTAAPVRFFVFP